MTVNELRLFMYRKHTAIVLLANLIFIASASLFVVSLAVSENADPESIRFVVADVSQAQMLPGVEVSIMSSKGHVKLGKTDDVGALLIARKTLRKAERPAVILFCLEWFYCGAIRLEEESFFEYEEHFIALAPYQVR